ncbi:S41 family peptidase [Flavitalea sp.]|nr:S41 family peptidase [Flavitalea sp.]
MQKIFLLVFLFSSFHCYTQKKIYTPAEIQRLGDLGRLWGALNYFHPQMGSGKVSTDKLALEPINALISDPSEKRFRKSVQMMLDIIGDKDAIIVPEKKEEKTTLFLKDPAVPFVHKLAGNKWYIALPTFAMEMNQYVVKIPGLMPDSWDSASAIIMDLRNETGITPHNYYTFLYDFLPALIKKLAGGAKLAEVFERNIYHSGFVPQTDGSSNIYKSGWITGTKGNVAESTPGKPLSKPFGFVINQNTSPDVVIRLMALRQSGVCTIIYESNGYGFLTGSSTPFELTDSVTINLRYSDYIITGNKTLPQPDLTVEHLADTGMNSSFITRAFGLVAGYKDLNPATTELDMQFILPKPGRFPEDQLPSADKRLYGLYNWWNAIQYFNPYKHLIQNNWDSILYKYVPVMLAADDSIKYNLAVGAMVSEIHDSHGFLGTVHSNTPARRLFGYSPPIQFNFIEERLYITAIGKDSLQDMTGIRMWDQVISIDGSSVKEASEKFRLYFATSNETTFSRDVINMLRGGPQNSILKLGLLRNGQKVDVELKRSGRPETTMDSVYFNDNYKVMQMLPGNIGYVNMGKLGTNLVDSMFRMFEKTTAIVFDIRNYPRGTSWSIVPGLASEITNAVMFDKTYVDYNHLTGGEDQGSFKSYFTVYPDKKRKPYKGKVIMLCNEQTQSQAEYTIMMFQGATKTTVIGSQTAGADGNVTDVVIPGGYTASFSGLGIYYPDGTPTQRTGIKIDIKVKPTLKGIKANKDEVLERALQYIRTGD